MASIGPQHWKTLDCIFTNDGFTYRGNTGDHRRYLKAGCIRPVIIPEYKDVGVEIIRRNMRTAGMSRERYFELLAQC